MNITHADLIAAAIPSGMDVSKDYEFFLDFAFENAVEIFDDETARELFDREDFVGELISAYEGR
jgi:hypothetical protein